MNAASSSGAASTSSSAAKIDFFLFAAAAALYPSMRPDYDPEARAATGRLRRGALAYAPKMSHSQHSRSLKHGSPPPSNPCCSDIKAPPLLVPPFTSLFSLISLCLTTLLRIFEMARYVYNDRVKQSEARAFAVAAVCCAEALQHGETGATRVRTAAGSRSGASR